MYIEITVTMTIRTCASSRVLVAGREINFKTSNKICQV